MLALDCQSVCLAYSIAGRQLQALQDVTVTVEKREFVSLLGPSGCGKSSLLNIVAGFLKPTAGKILVEGRNVEKPGQDRGVIFQEHALFPWMTARQNINFGLDVSGIPKDERDRKVDELIKLVGLTGFEHAFPSQL